MEASRLSPKFAVYFKFAMAVVGILLAFAVAMLILAIADRISSGVVAERSDGATNDIRALPCCSAKRQCKMTSPVTLADLTSSHKLLWVYCRDVPDVDFGHPRT